jgi:hypothetical protein
MKRVAVKTHPGKLGFRELYRCAGGVVPGILGCTLKLFRLLGPDNSGFGFRSFGDSLTCRDIDDISRRVREETEGYRAKVEKLGFVPGFAYSIEPYGAQEGHGQVLRHKNGTGGVNIIYMRQVRDGNETEATICSFCTPLKDDTYVITTGHKRQTDKPSTFLSEYLPGKSPADVWERHLERVEQSGVTPRRIATDHDLARIVLYCENEETEFNLERGVFVRMTREDIELGEELREEYEQKTSAGRKRRKKDDDDDDDDDDDEDEDDDERDEDDHDQDDEDDDDDDDDYDYRR